MEKKKCSCNSIVGKRKFSDKALGSNFEMIATTTPSSIYELEDEPSTSILKCNNCSSYYLFYNHGVSSTDKKEITIEKYYPKVSEKGLAKILKQFTGVVPINKIEEYSNYIEMMEKKEEKRNELKTGYFKN
jgi:hypothetical protein